MPSRFEGKRTTKPQGQTAKMPKGPDNRYFPWKYAHPEDSWECIPDPFWSPPVDKNGKVKAPPKAPVEDRSAAKAWGIRTDHPWLWVPRLKTFAFQPGISGVRLGKKGGGEPQVRQAVAVAEEDHGLFCIPWKSYPGGYIVEYETGHKGQHAIVYADVWTEILEVRGKKGGKQTLHRFQGPDCPAHKEDGITFDQWRVILVRDGWVEPPTFSGIDFALNVQEAHANRHQKHEATNPYFANMGQKQRYKLRMMHLAPIQERVERKGRRAVEPEAMV